MAPHPIADDDDDEFGLSSSDESALLAAADAHPAKRPRCDHTEPHDAPPAKRATAAQTPAYPPTSPLAVKILKQRFGLDQFRLEQEAVISRILAGGSAVVVFPTGGGKSLCYQVPALAFPELDAQQQNGRGPGDSGVTIVVSPLIALMKDQVDALQKRNINAVCMDSSKTRDEYLATMDALRAGAVRLLYCAPERLNNEGFVECIRSVRGGVRLVAVDEAHCISEWGHSFRPDYLKVARFVSEIKAERVVCLTATATPKVAQDICDAFGIDDTGLFRTPMYRSNLRLLVESSRDKQDAYPKLFRFLRQNPGPTIIYVTLQKQSEALASDLRQKGFEARHFHAGMQASEKTALQEEFMRRNDMVICATIAFGMGIDKANIRNVVHFNIPRSVEGYCQQIGRAGRDGLKSSCLLFLDPDDLYLQENLTYGDLPSRDSVRRFLQDVFSPEHQRLKVGETFNVSQYSQREEFDIRDTTLSILYAKIELQFGLIRATTPQYSKYAWVEINQRKLQSDRSAVSIAIQQNATKAKKYFNLDVQATCRAAGVNRADVIRKLNQWNDEDVIELKTSGVEHVYRILQKLPSTATETEAILDKLYKQMQDRERQDLLRTQAIVNLATESSCLSRRIGEYFDDKKDSALESGCGHCTWCETKAAVVMPERQPVPTDSLQVDAILQAVDARDDPRFLARVAYGIHSPRVTKLKLAKSPVFGSLCDHDFLGLVRLFTAGKPPAKTRGVARGSGRGGFSSSSLPSYIGRGSGRARGTSRYKPYGQ
ncbi:P-loop containing nucleoside triphosphate hydrolase protein [Macrophomina phaseolina]|uniref:ATP-dependent DNA helicase n=1 Tax=Macrophomina phaseolina TaxID=35725 RepID=A0ABQ8GPS5_9PEZI|nr:P-loop containing nucleoside triphosphate hydrolase protein [Macrophomina phaseolina]